MSLDARPMTSSTSMDSIHKHRRDRRRKSRLKRWSRPPRVPIVQREFTILPTRKTLTYAEAQKFVDVLSDGQVHRLNISDSIEIEKSKEVIDDIEKEQDDGEHTKDDAPIRNQFDVVCKSIGSDGLDVKRFVPFRLTQAYLRCFEKTPEEFDEEVEYDVDEEDIAWLRLLNDHRKATKLQSVSLDDLELVLDRLEKESHGLTMSASLRPENDPPRGKSSGGGSTGGSCCVCQETSTSATNSILVCDSCGLSVHQDCYGVPYHPDGQWLCKKCLKSPSSPVKCCLCPCSWKDKEGPGAMKQTSDGRWVHMVCALFIPEVSFGSNVYLEPVERIDKVPKWRHEMKCHGCNKAGRGACLGCQAPSCSQSFHALCAIRKGCYVRLVGSSAAPGEVDCAKSFTSKRTGDRRKRIFFCPSHVHLSSQDGDLKLNESAPNNNDTLQASKSEPDISLLSTVDHDSQTSVGKPSGKKVKLAKRPRKNSQLNNSSASACDPLLYLNAPIAIPNLSQESLVNIASHLSVRDRQQVMMRIHRYWLLKRHSRRGFPLIQRLQQVLLIHHMIKMQSSSSGLPSLDEESMKSLKKLRQDYEKVRLLLELIRKREKLKVDMLKMKEAEVELTLQPFCRLLRHTLEQLQSKDAIGLFARPVTEEEAPGYCVTIKKPMDYSTMASKIDEHKYKSMKDFKRDFDLIIDNCLEFNGIESPLYKIALKHRKQCSVILEAADRMSDRANFCPITGLHAGPVLPSAAGPKEEANINKHGNGDQNSEENDGKMESNKLDKLRNKLDDLNKRLDVLHVVRTKGVFQRVKQLRKEISLTKRRMTFLQQQQKNNSCNTSIPIAPLSVDSGLKKPNGRSVPPRSSRKRNVCRSLEDELTDSTVLEKSSLCDEGNSTAKRLRLSSDAMELLSASSLSSTTIITDFGGAPRPPSIPEPTISKFRPASRRSRLMSNTNLTHLKAKSPDRKTHSTPENVNKIKVTNSLLSKTLSFISPVRGDDKHPLVSDENKEPLANDKMLSTCHMRLRSFAPIKVDGAKPSRLARSKRCRKCSTSKEPEGKSNRCSVISADVEPTSEPKLPVPLPDLPVVPPLVRMSKRIQGRIKVESSTKNGLKLPTTTMANGDINNSIIKNESLKEGNPQKDFMRRLTRSSSMLSQNLPQPSEKDSILTECSSSTDHHLIKSNFIERSSNLSPEDEKMLTISPIVLVEKSSAKKTGQSTEEIDSSYESSYSLDSTDSSSTRKESTEVQEFSSQNDSNISDISKSIPSSDTEPSLNQSSVLCESKGDNKVEKASPSSSSTCSKDAEDLLTIFLPGDVAWAKTKGYPWYPAMIITKDCQPAEEPSVYFQNLIPPEAVSALRSKFTIPVHLVRFFDKRKNWQWLPRSKLDKIGADQKFDKERIGSVRQSILRKDIKRAYESALHQRRTALQKTLDDDRGKAEKSPAKRKIGIQSRQTRTLEKGQDVAREIGKNAAGNKQNYSSESTVDSVLEAQSPPPTDVSEVASQQPVMNCSQQFLNLSFQSEKLDAELSPNLQLVISQQPKMLSCTQ